MLPVQPPKTTVGVQKAKMRTAAGRPNLRLLRTAIMENQVRRGFEPGSQGAVGIRMSGCRALSPAVRPAV